MGHWFVVLAAAAWRRSKGLVTGGGVRAMRAVTGLGVGGVAGAAGRGEPAGASPARFGPGSTTDITGTADDTYACDACAPLPDGDTPNLFKFYDDKRRIQARSKLASHRCCARPSLCPSPATSLPPHPTSLAPPITPRARPSTPSRLPALTSASPLRHL